MARGAAGQGERFTKGMFPLAEEQGAQAREREGKLTGAYESLMNMGYTPEQKAAMTTAGMGAVGSAFDTASQLVGNEAARTRNTAGSAAQETALARAKGETMGSTAAGLQGAFAEREQLNRQLGLSGLEQLYGSNQQAMLNMYGLIPQGINAWSEAQMRNPVLTAVPKYMGAATGGIKDIAEARAA